MAGRRIRSQLVGIVIAAMLPLSGIAVWQWFVALDDARELVTTQLRATAWGLAESERDSFTLAAYSLTFAAAQPQVRNIGQGCIATLADALRNTSGIVNFLRTDANGRARCSVLPFQTDLDMSRNRWWIERQNRRQLYHASPQVGAISGQFVHIMVLPLFNDDGTFDGTLSTAISLQQIHDSMRDKLKGRAGVGILVNAVGIPILNSRDVGLSRLPDVRRASAVPQMATAKDGSEWTYVAAPLFDSEVYIAYAEPAELVSRGALARMWPNFLLALLALTLASIAIWFATQWLILRWLTLLQEKTARFARGDYTSYPGMFDNAPAELADFARNLQNMAHTIAAKESHLRSEIATREILSREVNHRVKNNLQIVTSLLSMQADRLQDRQNRATLERARARIAALGLIHRLLYESDENEATGRVPAQRLIPELCTQMRASYREHSEILIECDSADALVTADQAVPVALFIVEAVSNAYQHAFAEGSTGRIRVTLVVESDDAILRIDDDGRGFVVATAARNLGMDLVHAFAEQLEGSVAIDSGEKGATLTLRFPLPTD